MERANLQARVKVYEDLVNERGIKPHNNDQVSAPQLEMSEQPRNNDSNEDENQLKTKIEELEKNT